PGLLRLPKWQPFGASNAATGNPVGTFDAQRSERRIEWLLAVAGISVIAVGAPAFGSDVGGTLALVSAFALAAIAVSGKRISAGKIVVAVAVAFAVLTAVAALDYSRAEADRTHL